MFAGGSCMQVLKWACVLLPMLPVTHGVGERVPFWPRHGLCKPRQDVEGAMTTGACPMQRPQSGSSRVLRCVQAAAHQPASWRRSRAARGRQSRRGPGSRCTCAKGVSRCAMQEPVWLAAEMHNLNYGSCRKRQLASTSPRCRRCWH